MIPEDFGFWVKSRERQSVYVFTCSHPSGGLDAVTVEVPDVLSSYAHVLSLSKGQATLAAGGTRGVEVLVPSLQHFPCHKLPAGLTSHSKQLVVARLTVRLVSSGRGGGEEGRRGGGWLKYL